MGPTMNKHFICGNIARALRNFGYPDVTRETIAEVYDAYLSGKREAELPHGVIGRFAGKDLAELSELLGELPHD